MDMQNLSHGPVKALGEVFCLACGEKDQNYAEKEAKKRENLSES